MIRRPHPILGAALALLIAGCVGCSRGGDTAKGTTQRAYVVERIVPMGKLVGTAVDDGSIQPQSMPGDMLPDDAVTSVDDLRCQVAARDLPWGTILRRSMFVEPAKLGLERGLTGDTGQPTGCS